MAMADASEWFRVGWQVELKEMRFERIERPEPEREEMLVER